MSNTRREYWSNKIIKEQAEALRKRNRNKAIREGYIEGTVDYFFDRSGDLIESLVKECFSNCLTKLSHKHPSGFDFISGPKSYLEVKGNRAHDNFEREGKEYKIFLELTQNKRINSKNNLMSAQLKDDYKYQFMTVDTSPDNFGYFWLMDWKLAQADYRKLTATTNGGHNAYGVKVKPIHVLSEGNLFDIMEGK